MSKIPSNRLRHSLVSRCPSCMDRQLLGAPLIPSGAAMSRHWPPCPASGDGPPLRRADSADRLLPLMPACSWRSMAAPFFAALRPCRVTTRPRCPSRRIRHSCPLPARRDHSGRRPGFQGRDQGRAEPASGHRGRRRAASRAPDRARASENRSPGRRGEAVGGGEPLRAPASPGPASGAGSSEPADRGLPRQAGQE